MFYEHYIDPTDKRYSMIIDDDDRVAYAYILKYNKIVGDIWLYNVHNTPDKDAWVNKEELPFLNQSSHTKNLRKLSLSASDDIKISWGDVDGKRSVLLEINDDLKVMLQEGAKPGWSNNVYKDGPLAKVLVDKKVIL